MKRFLLVLAGVFMMLPMLARDFTYEYKGQTLKYTVLSEEDKTVETASGSAYNAGNSVSGDLILPDTVYDTNKVAYTLTQIGSYAFAYCSRLTSVSIPNSVTSIGAGAFRECSGLKKAQFASVEALCKIEFSDSYSNPLGYAHNLYINGEEIKDLVIPETVESIGSYAFYECSGLTSVSIPNSVTAIGNSAFYYCTGLTSVSIPNSVTAIGNSAFYYCTGLSSVSIGNSVTSIGNSAFRECRGLTSVSIPNSVTSIGESAFFNCRGLTSVSIGNSVTSIGSYAFYDCIGLPWVSIPNSVTSIGEYAFYYCTGLTSVSIGNAVTSIGSYAFSKCSGLSSVSIPNSVTSIGDSAFRECSGLSSVSIGNAVTSIGDSAFRECSGLSSVSIPNSVTSIGYSAFSDCTGLTSVSIGNSVTSISSYAFSYCRQLEKAEFASVEALCKIEFQDFNSNPLYYAHNLYINGEKIKDLVIPETVESIGSYAFYECRGLTSVSIPNSVTSIGESAFYNCRGLTSVSIGNSVTSIGISAFGECHALEKAEFASVEALCKIKFATSSSNPLCYVHNLYINGEKIKDLVIPETVESIGNYAFQVCTGLTSVSIPNSVTSIGNSAFYYCTGLTSVSIPNSVTSIGNSAFYNCTGLTSVSIGNSVKSIGESAFRECPNLTEIVIPPSVEKIAEYAFAGNYSLKDIIMGSNLKTIRDRAFDGCPADNVRITAQIPPSAPKIAFSKYGCLWVQGQEARNAYKTDFPCWENFSEYLTMVEPNGIKYEGETEVSVKPGDTFKLDVTLMPENVTLPQVFWRSSNPEIATVDLNGVVTVHKGAANNDTRANDEEVGTCELIAESLYADGPILKVKLTDPTASAETIFNDVTDGAGSIDWNAPVEIYNLNGRKMRSAREELAPGIYIARQGNKTEKFIKN